jgi:hypothetical protein
MTVGKCSFHSALHVLCTSITHKGKSLKIVGVHLETEFLSHGPVPCSRGGTAYQLCVRTSTGQQKYSVSAGVILNAP